MSQICSTNRPLLVPIVMAAVAAVVLFAPDAANAQTTGGLFGTGTNFLNALVNVLTSVWSRLIGIIAVIVTGIMWMTGRLDMGWAIAVTGGLILVFGAVAIVDSVRGAL